jgi:hypothetical protein
MTCRGRKQKKAARQAAGEAATERRCGRANDIDMLGQRERCLHPSFMIILLTNTKIKLAVCTVKMIRFHEKGFS